MSTRKLGGVGVILRGGGAPPPTPVFFPIPPHSPSYYLVVSRILQFRCDIIALLKIFSLFHHTPPNQYLVNSPIHNLRKLRSLLVSSHFSTISLQLSQSAKRSVLRCRCSTRIEMAARKPAKPKPKTSKLASTRKKQTPEASAKVASMSELDKKWMAESDMRTLREAAMIQADAKRLKAAAKMAAEQLKALQKVTKMP